MKTYDRAQVLQVAAQLLASRAYDHGGRLDHDPAECAVTAAKRLVDEVERQCPRPENQLEPTVAPSNARSGG